MWFSFPHRNFLFFSLQREYIHNLKKDIYLLKGTECLCLCLNIYVNLVLHKVYMNERFLRNFQSPPPQNPYL